MLAISESLIEILSLGAALAYSDRRDGNDASTRIEHYEIFAQSYFKTPVENLFLRPGIRFGYEAIPHDDSPQWVSISERTWRTGFEFGVVYDGYLIPSVTSHSSVIMRKLALRTNGAVFSNSSNFDRTEWLPVQAINFGLGLPFEGGKLVIEPFYRFVWIGGDSRQTSQWGIDASLALSHH